MRCALESSAGKLTHFSSADESNKLPSFKRIAKKPAKASGPLSGTFGNRRSLSINAYSVALCPSARKLREHCKRRLWARDSNISGNIKQHMPAIETVNMTESHSWRLDRTGAKLTELEGRRTSTRPVFFLRQADCQAVAGSR